MPSWCNPKYAFPNVQPDAAPKSFLSADILKERYEVVPLAHDHRVKIDVISVFHVLMAVSPSLKPLCLTRSVAARNVYHEIDVAGYRFIGHVASIDVERRRPN